MGAESFDDPAVGAEQTAEDTREQEEKELRDRINNQQAEVDEDARQVELAESRLSEARLKSEGDGVHTQEEIVAITTGALADRRRDLTANKKRLDDLREELRRSYQ